MTDFLGAHIPEVAFAAALAWASGLRLYLVLFVLGLLGYYGVLELPSHLQALSRPVVLVASGFMVAVEFSADKVPWVDSLWDAVHTFIRPIGGAFLAIKVLGDMDPVLEVVAALLAGGATFVTHGMKAGTRLVANHSPEPFS